MHVTNVRFPPIADISRVSAFDPKRTLALRPLQTFHSDGTSACVPADSTDFDYGSPTVPPGALFVAADEPLLIYPSVAAAERHLEAIDVENGVYPAAYGPNGELYRIGSEGIRVIIERTGEPNKPDELSALIRRYLEALGRAPDASATFGELVGMAWATESNFWQEHDPYGDRFGTRIPPWGCIAFLLVVAAALYVAFR